MCNRNHVLHAGLMTAVAMAAVACTPGLELGSGSPVAYDPPIRLKVEAQLAQSAARAANALEQQANVQAAHPLPARRADR